MSATFKSQNPLYGGMTPGQALGGGLSFGGQDDTIDPATGLPRAQTIPGGPAPGDQLMQPVDTARVEPTAFNTPPATPFLGFSAPGQMPADGTSMVPKATQQPSAQQIQGIAQGQTNLVNQLSPPVTNLGAPPQSQTITTQPPPPVPQQSFGGMTPGQALGGGMSFQQPAAPAPAPQQATTGLAGTPATQLPTLMQNRAFNPYFTPAAQPAPSDFLQRVMTSLPARAPEPVAAAPVGRFGFASPFNIVAPGQLNMPGLPRPATTAPATAPAPRTTASVTAPRPQATPAPRAAAPAARPAPAQTLTAAPTSGAKIRRVGATTFVEGGTPEERMALMRQLGLNRTSAGKGTR